MSLQNIAKFITKFFPLWVIGVALLAYFVPDPIKPLGKTVPYLLGVVMLGMGLTMTPGDFRLVFTRPKDVLFGVVLRCVIMPSVAFAIAWVLNLPPYLAAGLILVGCCPSGTASNVMTFIAKGDTALSVTMTSVITLMAPILTPYTFLLLAGTIIPIDALALLTDILKIVLFPVIAGVVIRMVAGKLVDRLMPIIPLLSVAAIIMIVAVVVAGSASRLASVAVIAFIAVALHNGLGLGLSYGISRMLRLSPKTSKAITFEVGMENSGLAVALALAHLDPVAAIPGVIFSVWHNFTGSLLAGYWGGRDTDEAEDAESAKKAVEAA